MYLDLTGFVDLSLFLLRVIVAIIFIASGVNDLKNPTERSQGIGFPKGFTMFLGSAEIAGGVGLILGIFTQFAAIGLGLIMLGAISKKAFTWKTGFWGKKSMGWHYDLMLLLMNLVILTTGGGSYVIWG